MLWFNSFHWPPSQPIPNSKYVIFLPWQFCCGMPLRHFFCLVLLMKQSVRTLCALHAKYCLVHPTYLNYFFFILYIFLVFIKCIAIYFIVKLCELHAKYYSPSFVFLNFLVFTLYIFYLKYTIFHSWQLY